jgi:predicted MFS family arabinose efflux permease
MPFIGPLIQKTGSRIIILLSSIATAMILPVLTLVDSPFTLAISLFIFGSALGSLDIAMNAQAVIVQEHMSRPVMSSFHGMFSLGGLLGAMVLGLLMMFGLTPALGASVISFFIILIAIIHYKNFIDHPAKQEAASFSLRLPKGPILFLGIFCFIAFLSEGAMLDWSALFLKENRGFSLAMAGTGYSVFSVAMALMRFTGDNLVHKYGPEKIVLWGALIAASGLLIAVVLPWQATSLIGFLLIGIGASNIVPVLFSAAGKADRNSPELALAAVTTMGYAGQLAGPAMIGFVAHLTTLPVALGLMAGPLLIVAFTFTFGKRGSSVGA